MPRDASGTYTRAVADYVSGNVAEPDGATGVNTEMDDIATALTGSLAADGSKQWGANQATGGFWANLLGNTRVYTTTGSANAYVITTGASLTDYTSRIIFAKLNFGNTGACTLNVDAVGATAIKIAGADPASGDLVSGQVYAFAHDGTNWEVIAGLLLPLADIAGLARTDGGIIVGDGANFVLESGATARTSLGLAIGTDVLAQQTIGIADDNLLEVDAAAGAPNATEYARFTANGLEGRTEAELKSDLNLEIGTDVQAFDADTLKADVGDTLTAGYLSDSFAGGVISSGTYTPAPKTGEENFQHITNGGAFILAPPASPCTVVLEITNNASAGAITTTAFTKVTGDDFTTTNGDDFLCHITKSQNFSHLSVTALQ